MRLCNWGCHPVVEADVRGFRTAGEARSSVAGWADFIPRGLGRCYGDSALSGRVLSTLGRDCVLEFDREQGLLTCEAGVSFAEILALIVPAGWFLPVTPGTKFVTLGGAIASDVHGKNHHRDGSFSRHVRSLTLLGGDGRVHECSPEREPEIFWATAGGMGLTGVILQATVRLRRIETAYVVEESTKARNLEHLIALFGESMERTYSVAWIDCLARGASLGRGVLLNGEHAGLADLRSTRQRAEPLALPAKLGVAVPLTPPISCINLASVTAFNALFYARVRRGTHRHLTDYDTYFYPLDRVAHWNRAYGPRGFAQYQCVVPPKEGPAALERILQRVSEERLPSFLSVLKYFGPGDPGLLSFPMEGYTLTLDLPMSERLLRVFDQLDEIVAAAGGRLYLTKDCRMSAATFRAGYPRLSEFEGVKRRLDPGNLLQSAQSRRLGIAEGEGSVR